MMMMISRISSSAISLRCQQLTQLHTALKRNQPDALVDAITDFHGTAETVS